LFGFREFSWGPKDITVWCSNDYLGMSAHPAVKEAVKQVRKLMPTHFVKTIRLTRRYSRYLGIVGPPGRQAGKEINAHTFCQDDMIDKKLPYCRYLGIVGPSGRQAGKEINTRTFCQDDKINKKLQ
jgi:hypothetical protein